MRFKAIGKGIFLLIEFYFTNVVCWTQS